MAPSRWLPWFLRRFFLTLAGCLILLILVCPFLDDGGQTRTSGRELLALFARDLAVRRTVIASSLGLAVTALIFFRAERDSDVVSPQSNDSFPLEEPDLER
jgi:hypothetical protein